MMTSEYKQRKRRLADWDYSSGGIYFVTFCTIGREPLLGRIISAEDSSGIEAVFQPSRIGALCEEAIANIGDRFDGATIDRYTIMPNHVHLLIEITEESACEPVGRHAKIVPQIVASIKSAVTRKAREESLEFKVWQQSYHDHIVRNEADLSRIREYIDQNPLKWAIDKFYVE